MDAQFIPFADDSFDCILCSHMLEHVPDDLTAMREMFRVLKPGRWAILQVPLGRGRDETFEDPTITSPAERERVFGQRDHVRIYGRDYEARLARVGFRAEFDSYMKDLPSDAILKYGLSTQDLFWVTKPAG
jgi:SAM-dependent methyltransferase